MRLVWITVFGVALCIGLMLLIGDFGEWPWW